LFSLVVAASFAVTGCVGPLACGPAGCDVSGPVALNQCDGCDACDGCGELYVDPWINHPADVCDPCDRCGNYNGQSCGKCRPMFAGFRSLWGYRCDPPPPVACGGCGSNSCDACAPACDACGDCAGGCGDCAGGPVVSSVPTVSGVPTVADEIVVESPQAKPEFSVPERSRKIFRKRDSGE
jgi:hypothetical protein